MSVNLHLVDCEHRLELNTLMVSCAKNFRFIDIRERTGFMNITSVNQPLLKVAFEPYNNIQFAGANGNDVAVYDRRFLSKAVYEMKVGVSSGRAVAMNMPAQTKDTNITHLEYNPNKYSNISCASAASGVVYELDVSPSVSYAHHLVEGKTVEQMKQTVARYAQKFSYGVKEIVSGGA